MGRKSTRKGDSSVQRTVTVTTAPPEEQTSALSRQVRPDLYFQERTPALKDLITEKQVESKQSVFITKLTEAIQAHSLKTPRALRSSCGSTSKDDYFTNEKLKMKAAQAKREALL